MTFTEDQLAPIRRECYVDDVGLGSAYYSQDKAARLILEARTERDEACIALHALGQGHGAFIKSVEEERDEAQLMTKVTTTLLQEYQIDAQDAAKQRDAALAERDEWKQKAIAQHDAYEKEREKLVAERDSEKRFKLVCWDQLDALGAENTKLRKEVKRQTELSQRFAGEKASALDEARLLRTQNSELQRYDLRQTDVPFVPDERIAENERLRLAFERTCKDHDMATYEGDEGGIVLTVRDCLAELRTAIEGKDE